MTLDDIASGTGVKSDDSHKQGQWRSKAIMINTQPDTREQKLRDLLTIRSYLRERVDELVAERLLSQANAVAAEVSRLNTAIAKAEAEAGQ